MGYVNKTIELKSIQQAVAFLNAVIRNRSIPLSSFYTGKIDYPFNIEVDMFKVDLRSEWKTIIDFSNYFYYHYYIEILNSDYMVYASRVRNELRVGKIVNEKLEFIGIE